VILLGVELPGETALETSHVTTSVTPCDAAENLNCDLPQPPESNLNPDFGSLALWSNQPAASQIPFTSTVPLSAFARRALTGVLRV